VRVGKAAVRREARSNYRELCAMMPTELEAADEVAKSGIEAEVIEICARWSLDSERLWNR